MIRVRYTEPSLSDVAEFAAVMREADRRELKRWTGNGPEYELRRAVELSRHCLMASLPDGAPLSMFGVAESSILESEAVVWELSTVHVERHRFLFARESRRMFEAMCRLMPHTAEFSNYVDMDYARAVSWIEWLGGFISLEGSFRGACGGTFGRFTIPNPHYRED